jgi:hypothetical protein
MVPSSKEENISSQANNPTTAFFMVKLKRTLVCAMLLFAAHSSYCQLFNNTVYNRKAVYAEVYGTGLGATLNYEYLYQDYGAKKGIRAGAGYFVNFFENHTPTIISANLEYVSFAGTMKHHLEWGLGATYQYKYYKETVQSVTYYISGSDTVGVYTDHDFKFKRTGPAVVPRLGYRYEDPDGGLVIRIAWTPVLYLMNSEKTYYDGAQIDKKFIPFSTRLGWGGISIGYSFY